MGMGGGLVHGNGRVGLLHGDGVFESIVQSFM